MPLFVNQYNWFDLTQILAHKIAPRISIVLAGLYLEHKSIILTFTHSVKVWREQVKFVGKKQRNAERIKQVKNSYFQTAVKEYSETSKTLQSSTWRCELWCLKKDASL